MKKVDFYSQEDKEMKEFADFKKEAYLCLSEIFGLFEFLSMYKKMYNMDEKSKLPEAFDIIIWFIYSKKEELKGMRKEDMNFTDEYHDRFYAKCMKDSEIKHLKSIKRFMAESVKMEINSWDLQKLQYTYDRLLDRMPNTEFAAVVKRIVIDKLLEKGGNL